MMKEADLECQICWVYSEREAREKTLARVKNISENVDVLLSGFICTLFSILMLRRHHKTWK